MIPKYFLLERKYLSMLHKIIKYGTQQVEYCSIDKKISGETENLN